MTLLSVPQDAVSDRAPPAPRPAGSARGSVRVLLRLEGFAALAAALFIYGRAGFSWPALAVLFLAPDLTMLFYFAAPRIGALAYNLVHTFALALALTLVGFFGGPPAAAACGLILIAHVGFDRMLGYGLKYASSFSDTHLGRIGRR